MNKRNNLRSGRRPLLGLLAVLAVLAAIAVAGCGGSSGDSTSADTTSSGGGAEAGGMPPGGSGPGGFEIDAEARECLEEQGVELPDPGGGPPEGGAPPTGEPPQGGPPEGFGGGEDIQKAFEECGIDAPQGGGPGGGPPTDSPEFRESIEGYVACVRENGYDLPDPNLSGEGPVFDESEVDQSDPEFKAASEKCQSLIGAPGEMKAEAKRRSIRRRD